MMILRFLALVVLFVAAAGGAAFAQQRIDGDRPFAFWNGHTSKFELRTLSPPTSGASVKQREAEQAAIGQFPNATGVLESRLVDYTEMNSASPRLCWMISLAPAAELAPAVGPPRAADAPTPAAARFFLVFIDARAGEFVMGAGVVACALPRVAERKRVAQSPYA